MAIKPILFNTEMVRAILDGRKDATRRIVKGFIPDDAVWGYTAFTPKGYISCRGTFADGYGEKFFKLPCEPGDILYVRETWHKYTKRIGKGESCRLAEFYGYKASVANSEDAEEPWRPSTQMPKEAARIWLKLLILKHTKDQIGARFGNCRRKWKCVENIHSRTGLNHHTKQDGMLV